MEQYNENCFCREQMRADEHILWSGKPEKKGRHLTTAERGAFALSVLALFVSLPFGYLGLAYPNGDWVTNILLLIFPVIGIAMVTSQFVKLHRLKNDTEYVITNRKIYRRCGQRVDSFPASISVSYETEYHKCGTATIRFPMAVDPHLPRVRVNKREIPQYFALVNIGEVEEVLQVLTNMSAQC